MDDVYIVKSDHIWIAQRFAADGHVYYPVFFYKAKYKLDHIEIIYDREEAFNRALKYVEEVIGWH